MQLVQQLLLLRRRLADARQSLNLCSYYLQVMLLFRRQALDGNLGFDDSGGRGAHSGSAELMLRGRRCRGRRLGRLRHGRHFLLIGGGGLRGRPWLRLRLKLDLDVRLLRLGLRSGLGRLCDLIVDDKERRV